MEKSKGVELIIAAYRYGSWLRGGDGRAAPLNQLPTFPVQSTDHTDRIRYANQPIHSSNQFKIPPTTTLMPIL
ncbi:MAG: hypothetical protein K2H52_00640 [Lachnospiraceae bacterium]|nr:hypothetical protein [Lachnospiraceae bacterium]MDE6184796.1 hypothetical protein [Lachnospiraceae bacterium]